MLTFNLQYQKEDPTGDPETSVSINKIHSLNIPYHIP